MNGEKRIFPFYKGEYMGVEPIGFSNLKSAQAYMQKIPDKEIYDACFGGEDKYVKKYGYFCGLTPYKRHMEVDYSQKYYLKDMDSERVDELLRESKKLSGLTFKELENMVDEFHKKYGLYHWVYTDDKEFKKAKTKFYKENVEYREGILEVNVKWNDGSITPAPERK